MRHQNLPHSSEASFTVVGAPSLDIILPVGMTLADFGSDSIPVEPHSPGRKVVMSPESDALIPAAMDVADFIDLGGNAPNKAAYLAHRGHNVELVTAVGECAVSQQILELLAQRSRIGHSPNTHPDFVPSVSVIEHMENSDRMIRGRRRTPLGEALDPSLIERAMKRGSYAIASSLKDGGLNEFMYAHTAEHHIPLLHVPGSSEYGDPDALQRVMTDTRDLAVGGELPRVLALNADKELPALFGEPEDGLAQAMWLARRATSELGFTYVIATRGLPEPGAVMAHEDHVIFQPAERAEVVDSTGAGDRFSAVVFEGLAGYLASGRTIPLADARQLLRDGAQSARSVISHMGGHGDIFKDLAA